MLKIPSLSRIENILRRSRSIAVVGFSPKEERPSHDVGKFLIDTGYTVYPVNPGVSKILGHVCYPDLFSIPASVDIVNIFRRSEDVEPLVEAAITVGAKVVWMQQGVINHQAAKLADDAGLEVIMDRCIKIDYQDLLR